eukprot:6645755-Prymnesium_polylepis.1
MQHIKEPPPSISQREDTNMTGAKSVGSAQASRRRRRRREEGGDAVLHRRKRAGGAADLAAPSSMVDRPVRRRGRGEARLSPNRARVPGVG